MFLDESLNSVIKKTNRSLSLLHSRIIANNFTSKQNCQEVVNYMNNTKKSIMNALRGTNSPISIKRKYFSSNLITRIPNNYNKHNIIDQICQ